MTADMKTALLGPVTARAGRFSLYAIRYPTGRIDTSQNSVVLEDALGKEPIGRIPAPGTNLAQVSEAIRAYVEEWLAGQDLGIARMRPSSPAHAADLFQRAERVRRALAEL